MRAVLILAGVVAVAGLAACTERPQTAGARNVDANAWQGAPGAFTAAGWKVGDQASWEAQMRHRALTQNESVRIAVGQN
jgi:hypothetical protein